MLRSARRPRRLRGQSLALIALGAACSGNVEHRSGSSGGTAVGGSFGDAGTHSVGGTSFGGALGSSGGGVGGTVGFAGSFGCFVAGTRIATPAGTLPIEELRIGDLVLAYDEQAERAVPRPVTATFVHPDHPVGALPLSDGHVLRVTANHPVYLPDQDRYADAGELTGNERLLTLSGSGRTSSLIAGAFQLSAADPVTVYNITVAGEHNYFAEGVLVHNKSGAGGTGVCSPISFAVACTPIPDCCSSIAGCLDPLRPTPEYVTLNQIVGPDAGPADSGLADSGPVDSGSNDSAHVDSSSMDAAPDTRVPLIGGPICNGSSNAPSPSYLAFDVSNKVGEPPAVAIYSGHSGNTLCSGAQIGELWIGANQPPPVSSATTQCVRMPQQSMTHVKIVALNAGTEVSNPRFVSGCACPRRLIRKTTCGYEGSDSGACE